MISPCYHDPSHGIRFPDVTCDGVQAKKKKKTGTKTLKNDRGIGKRLKMRVTAREEKVHPNIKSPLLLDYLMLMIRTVLYVLQIFL